MKLLVRQKNHKPGAQTDRRKKRIKPTFLTLGCFRHRPLRSCCCRAWLWLWRLRVRRIPWRLLWWLQRTLLRQEVGSFILLHMSYYELLYEMKHQFLRIDNSLYPYFLLLNGNSTGPLMLRLRLMLSPPPPLSPDMVTTAMDMDTALTGKD